MKRKRISEPQPRSKPELDGNVPLLFLSREKRAERERLKASNALKVLSVTRNQELFKIIGVDENRKICPVFQKPAVKSDTRQPEPSEAPLAGILPLCDTNHYNYPQPLKTSATFDLRPVTAPSDHPFDYTKFIDRLKMTISDAPLPTPRLEQVEPKRLNALRTAQFPPASTADWVAGRLGLNSAEAKKIWKFLAIWQDERRKKRTVSNPLAIIQGPTGCGKSALVSAAALECDFQVLEVSPSNLTLSGPAQKLEGLISEALHSRQFGDCMQMVVIEDLDACLLLDPTITTQVISLVQSAKRPIIITTSSEPPAVLAGAARVHAVIERPSKTAISLLVSHVTGIDMSRAWRLAGDSGGDLRAALHAATVLRGCAATPDFFDFSGLPLMNILRCQGDVEEKVDLLDEVVLFSSTEHCDVLVHADVLNKCDPGIGLTSLQQSARWLQIWEPSRWERVEEEVSKRRDVKRNMKFAVQELAGPRNSFSLRGSRLGMTASYVEAMACSEGSGRRRCCTALDIWGCEFSHVLPILTGKPSLSPVLEN